MNIKEHPEGDISEGANPYLHDHFNCGSNLRDAILDARFQDVEIMSYGVFDKDVRQFQLIDKKTGKRVVVEF